MAEERLEDGRVIEVKETWPETQMAREKRMFSGERGQGW